MITMDNVTVLEECVNDTLLSRLISLTSLVLIYLISMYVVKWILYLGKYKMWYLSSAVTTVKVATAIIFSVSMIIFGSDFTYNISRKFCSANGTYIVSINDNTNMEEFYNTYNIISYENGIYTVSEK